MSLIDKIKLLFKLQAPVGKVVDQVKTANSGNWKSITFWIALLGTLGSVAANLSGLIPAPAALIISTAITVAYNVLRAIQNADQTGSVPLFQSTRFWLGILGILAAAFDGLKQGGVNPTWMASAMGVIGAIMAGAQSMGAQQPSAPAATK